MIPSAMRPFSATLAAVLLAATLLPMAESRAAGNWIQADCPELLSRTTLPAQVEDTSPLFRVPPETAEPSGTPGRQAGRKKVLILSSTFGMGHTSAARAVEAEILKRDPQAVVVIKQVEELRSGLRNWLEHTIFWTVIKHFPWFYDWSYKREMAKVTSPETLESAREHVKRNVLLDYIRSEDPTEVISVHQLSAISLALLRRSGELRDVRVGFVSTDYFEEYLPIVSNELDMTFVPHPKLARAWLARGVPEEKVVATGIPVHPDAFMTYHRRGFLASRGLDPDQLTITLASGGEGIGDYPRIVESVADAFESRPLQIIAVCGHNRAHFRKLNRMKEKLRARGVELAVLGFIGRSEMFGLISSSDAYITKSGGLSPSEGFAMNKPMILLDVYGGHERENARFFEELGLALINREQDAIGSQLAGLLSDKPLQRRMSEAQRAFIAGTDFGRIADFVFPQPALR